LLQDAFSRAAETDRLSNKKDHMTTDLSLVYQRL